MLILFSPVLVIVSILIYIKLGLPIFYKQTRPGKDEVFFRLIKFRSMSNDKDKQGNLLKDQDRLTKFGRFLRSSSIDELPELWCILKGDMSFVGPRPLSVKYLPFYTETEAKRHDVLPGLTGLSQVSGRNTLNWDERLKLDVYYVENISFKNDFRIILKTIEKVVLRKDVVVAGTGKVGDLDEIREIQRPEYFKN